MRFKAKGWIWIGAGLALAVLACVWGLRLAAKQLQSQIVQALGPRASVGAVELGWTGVELRELRIAADTAPRAWPARDELRAERVRVRPDLRGLWSGVSGGPWRIASIDVHGAYLSMLRTPAGKLRLLPALLETGPAKAGSAQAQSTPPHIVIGEVRLHNAALDFHDASLRSGMHRMQIEKLDASAGPIELPALDKPVRLDLQGRLKGVHHDGRIDISGRVTPATRDAKISAAFSGVDLIALQPYLVKLSEAGIRRGRLDLKLDATVEQMRLHAPGVVTLSGLELSSGGGLLGGIAGLPRQALLNAMKRDGRIRIKFALDGRLDDPAFSVNENFATRTASGLAETLGVSVGGVVEGVGGVIKGLLGR